MGKQDGYLYTGTYAHSSVFHPSVHKGSSLKCQIHVAQSDQRRLKYLLTRVTIWQRRSFFFHSTTEELIYDTCFDMASLVHI